MSASSRSLRRLDTFRAHSGPLLAFAVVSNLIVAAAIATHSVLVALCLLGVTALVVARRATALFKVTKRPSDDGVLAYHRGAVVSFSTGGLVMAVTTFAVQDAPPSILVLLSMWIIVAASLTTLALSTVTKHSGFLFTPAFIALALVAIPRDPTVGPAMAGLLFFSLSFLAMAGRQAFVQQAQAEKAEEEARAKELEAKTALTQFLGSSDDLAFMIDGNLRFTYVSDNALGKHSGSGLEMEGRSLEDVISSFILKAEESDHAMAHSLLQKAARHEKVYQHTLEIWSQSRRSFVYKAVTAIPLFSDNGRFEGYRGWAVDITERQSALREAQQARAEIAAINDQLEMRVIEATKELEAQVIEAREANRAKSRFLAMMSHEIRTPLNPIINMASTIERTTSEDEVRTLAKVVKTSGSSLLVLLNDILDFSKVQAGKLDLTVEAFDLAAVCEEVVDLLRPTAEEQGLEFVFDMDEGARAHLLGDRFRMRQIITNVIGNAVKFTEKGSVRFCVRSTPGTDLVDVAMTVEDTGPGIDDSVKEKVFGEFDQGSGLPHQKGGTGLGLAICKELLHLMGGRIWVEDGAEGGSRFEMRLSLPLAHQTAEVVERAPKRGPRHVQRCLVVDDNEPNRLVLKAMLAPYGWPVDLAENGLSAIEMAEETDYDVVFMDVSMPVMDGYEATRELRRRETATGRSRAFVIGATAHAFEAELQMCLEAGMDEVITKPLKTEDLIDLLGEAPPARGAGKAKFAGASKG